MSAATAAPDAIRPTDFLGIDHLLSDEERDIRDTVRAFVARPGRPERRRLVRGGDDPARAGAGARQARRARHAPRGLRLRRRQRDRLRPRVPGARGRRQRRPQPRLGAGLAGDVRDPPLGLGGAEAGVAAADGRRRGDRLLRPDRARRRLGPRRDAHPRAPRRRRLDPARPEDVDHQRLDRRRRGRLGADRRGRARLPRPEGHARASRPRTSTEAVAARVDHLRAAARRRAPARRARCCPRRRRCAARCRA